MELINIVGLIAAFCTSSAFFPQAFKVIKSRDTKSLSLVMYVIFTMGVMLWLVYGIFRKDFVLIAANLIILIPACIILFFKATEKRRDPVGSEAV